MFQAIGKWLFRDLRTSSEAEASSSTGTQLRRFASISDVQVLALEQRVMFDDTTASDLVDAAATWRGTLSGRPIKTTKRMYEDATNADTGCPDPVQSSPG